jgi:DNA gyrase inhibitor GyrI
MNIKLSGVISPRETPGSTRLAESQQEQQRTSKVLTEQVTSSSLSAARPKADLLEISSIARSIGQNNPSNKTAETQSNDQNAVRVKFAPVRNEVIKSQLQAGFYSQPAVVRQAAAKLAQEIRNTPQETQSKPV